MLRMAQVNYIKDLYEKEEKSLREISRITGHDFRTVKKYAQQDDWNEPSLPDIEPKSYPVLGPYIPIVDTWLEEDRKVPRKQRHTAKRIWDRLKEEHGFPGGYTTVKEYVRLKKHLMRMQRDGYIPLEHLPGDASFIQKVKRFLQKNSSLAKVSFVNKFSFCFCSKPPTNKHFQGVQRHFKRKAGTFCQAENA